VRVLWAGWLVLSLLLLPALSAVWMIPGFMSQDGPAHLYNAWILSRSFESGSPLQAFFEVRWQPVPNWAAHLLLAGLLQIVSPWAADRVMMTATSLGFAAALVWMRWRTRGGEGLLGTCLLSAVLSINFLWIMGFHGFLLGCCIFSITLGVWWSGRADLGRARILALILLLVLGYFAHLVSLGLTVFALGFLASFAPIQSASGKSWLLRGRLVRRTVLACLPLFILALFYARLARQGGTMRPVWENLSDPYSLRAWVSRLGWVDPYSIARKLALPFTDRIDPLFVLLTPALWLAIAGFLWLAQALWSAEAFKRWRGVTVEKMAQRPSVEVHGIRLVWLLLGLTLTIGGIAGPDSFGSGHGEYLPQRLVLLGLAALLPGLDLKPSERSGRLIAGTLLAALLLQTILVWDHALYSETTAGHLIRATDLVGRQQRIATLLISARSRFRANSLLHADCWLGIETDNILWSNYETRHYYFPVQFRPALDRPDPYDFERIAFDTYPTAGVRAKRLWTRVLADHYGSIDRVLVWGRDPLLDDITREFCDLESARGEVRVFVPRSHSRQNPAMP
jgi:hypothetical protein